MIIKRIIKSDPEYPKSLQRFLGENAPESAATLGNLELLSHATLAIFCSSACPAGIISESEQVMHKIMDASVSVIGGFHSEVEKRCLTILLDGDQPIIISPARSIQKLRIRPEYRKPLENGRLLFLSFFRSHRHRSDTAMALRRNQYVAALADRILILHATPDSKTEQLCRQLTSWGKSVYTIDNAANQSLTRRGAKTITGLTTGQALS
jgi:predicted Rossmann fold nucleotide-binding protein DprA/Smf involved in DNA uptake